VSNTSKSLLIVADNWSWI